MRNLEGYSEWESPIHTHHCTNTGIYVAIPPTRGPVIDTTALLESLERGLISGAGLDVTPEEPLAADSPLWDHPHVIVTPHASGGSPLRLDRTIDLFYENLRRFTEGHPLLGIIDKHKGY